MNRPRKIEYRNARRVVPAWILAISVLAACGGEGPDVSAGAGADKPSSPECNTTGAIEGGGRHRLSGLVSEVDASGDLIVSDVRMSIAAADIVVDGADATAATIKRGELVTVTGAIDFGQRTGCATQVFADAYLTGSIDSVDVAARIITILGQQIAVPENTVFGDGLALDSLQVGSRIRVSGLVSTGSIVASRIDFADISEGYFVSGNVTGLETSGHRFLVNGILVLYDEATLADFPAGELRDGDTVRLTGTAFEPGDSSSPGSSVIRPARLEYIDYGTPLSISPASASVSPGRSVRFLTSQDAGAVTWRVSSGDGTACDAASCGTIDAGGRYSAPSSGGSTPSLLITVTSVADPRISATAVVLVTTDYPDTLSGPHTVIGEVFSTQTGAVANASVNLWVQQQGGGFSYWWSHGRLASDASGRFEAPNLPDSHVALVAFASGYVQPCAVTANVEGDVEVRLEVVPVAVFDALDPPRPALAVEPSVSGQVFEITATGRQPVAGASLWLEETMGITYATTLSDLGGRYFVCNVDDLPTLAWVTVAKDGFQVVSVGPVNASTSKTLDIELKRL
jgi:hypothetical protein